MQISILIGLKQKNIVIYQHYVLGTILMHVATYRVYTSTNILRATERKDIAHSAYTQWDLLLLYSCVHEK